MSSARIAAWWLLAAGPAFGYQAKGMVEGMVVNRNTGAPLKKATVRLRQTNPAQGQMQVAATRETDDSGRFVFNGLAAGKYQMSAERQGFLSQNFGGRKYSTAGTPVLLGQDGYLKDIVFRLSPQSVIAGRVLDEDGEPVANIRVSASRQRYVSGKKQWSSSGEATTSDLGEYRIANLTPGRYIVNTASRNRTAPMMQGQNNDPLPDKPEMIYSATYYPGASDSAAASPLDVRDGAEVRGIDIRLVKTRVFRVRGQVAAASGGRGGVMVTLMPKDGRGSSAMSQARPPDYQFEFRGVAPGSYIAVARTPGNPQQQSTAYLPVEVLGGHVEGLVLTPAPGVDLQGTIKVEEKTIPLESLSVNLRPMGFAAGPMPARGRTGADGKFTLKNVGPGLFTAAVAGLPQNCYVKSIYYGGHEVPESGVEMNTQGALEIAIAADAGQVDGVIMDKDGKPVAGATVALIPKDGKGPITANRADENGIVTFRTVRPGEYRMLAWEDVEPGAYQDPDFVKPLEGQAKTVKVEPNGHEAVQVKAIPAETQ